MLEDEFSIVQEKYELAKIYAMTCDLDNLGMVSSDIDRFWEKNRMTENELGYVVENRDIIDKHIVGIVEGHLASLWDCALDGDSKSMLVRSNGCLEYFRELKKRKVLSNRVMCYAMNMISDVWSVYDSGLNISLLGSFNDACEREDGDDIMCHFDQLKFWSGNSTVVGPCLKD